MFTSLPNEEWRKVEGFSQYYVSNFGRIRSHRRIGSGKIIKQTVDKKGYCRAQIYDGDSSCKRVLVHRIVAMAFVHNPNRDINKEINHLDGNKQNNLPGNLEWCNRKGNMMHAHSHGLMKNVGLVSKFDDKFKLLQTEVDGTPVRAYLNAHEAEQVFGADFSAIRTAVRVGKRYCGYLWRSCSNEEYEKYCDCIVVKRKAGTHYPSLPVLKVSENGEVLCEYPSQQKAADASGVTRRAIGRAIKYGSRCAGYYWRVRQKPALSHNNNSDEKVDTRLLVDEGTHTAHRI